jgi:protein-tyrosine-phosphatase
MKKLMYVCYKNRGRSPLLERATRELVDGRMKVISRGVASEGHGWRPGEWYVETCGKLGVNISDHVSRRAELEDMESSDLVLASDREVEVKLKEEFPEHCDKVQTVRSFAVGRRLEGTDGNLDDSYVPRNGVSFRGRKADSSAAYGYQIHEIRRLARRVVRRLENEN